MDNNNFDRAFAYVVGDEGKYVNNPHDSGGPTNFGITQAVLSVHLGRPASVQEVKDLPLATAKEIYSQRYWRPLGCDSINNAAIATCMFDIGVVRGISVPPQYAQQICNAHGSALAVDGHLGPLSLAAINAINPKLFVYDFAAKARNGFLGILARRPSQIVFIKGWLRRADRLKSLVV